ncbi:hypothetical protein G9409_08195 [Chlorobium sp. BLA1]|uniref:hypothetical protein n=1 Tax=Candidatus Chlorobium masyuteum TaxID=2716876 RepID=UPI0014217D3E|nr:hypothetical protein [Candidatus Chlorobium masyuteum]NHQ60566.1 hypothetical protein [Candidatus Chlorobium masyuteum]
MNFQQLRMVREAVEKKAVLLKKVEGKYHAVAGVPYSNYIILQIRERTFVLVQSNIFKVIIKSVLVMANNKFPKNFGTGNSKDVLEAIYNIEPWWDIDKFSEVLKNEQFCYVVEIKGGEILENVLRIDLFREYKQINSVKNDFVGGLFHCLKHFSYNGKPLSTHKQINDVKSPMNVIEKIVEIFYFGMQLKPNGKNINFEIGIDETYKYHLGTFFEEATEIYFVNTLFIRKMK